MLISVLVSFAVILTSVHVLAAGPTASGIVEQAIAAHHGAKKAHHEVKASPVTDAVSDSANAGHKEMVASGTSECAGVAHNQSDTKGDSHKQTGKSSNCCDLACHTAVMNATEFSFAAVKPAHIDTVFLSLCFARQTRLDRPPRSIDL